MTNSRKRFTLPQRLLHWLMAICILSMLFIGVGMVSTITPKYLTLVQLHKPLGIAILVLALIRLALRIYYGAPSLPTDLPEPMKLAAHLSQYLLYALMISMPLFGSVHLPSILPVSASLHTFLWHAHYCLAFLFFAVILLHVAAILFHKLIRRDGVFETMAPVFTHDRSE
jgi:cytochrome b561